METEKKPLVQVKNLKKYFNTGHKEVVKALDNVSFDIYEGETVGLVGESGCGKTTCGRLILGLYDKTDGQVLYRGKDVHRMSRSEKYAFKKNAQIVFQDPYSSLDPRMTVADIIAEGIDIHHLAKDRKERLQKIYYYLNAVGLNESHASRFVHEFSGGQRQRIGIARALAVEPEFIMLDEPISALDVSIQAQVVNLLIKLQKEKGLTYLFVAHDLAMVKHISDRIVVMYLGTVVETASSEALYAKPLHPYTQALISAIPIPDPELERKRAEETVQGEATVAGATEGCRFRTRCKFATERCAREMPELREVEPGHFAACHNLDQVNP
ncbi:MAG: oligopeptide/dipeptide ABC transporter ATP-binding protein [Oscillospiraceae bacterium]|nr:oligopeptide/dipeptide ABC transporter ATP-binding protein [Oscillospiraceae bacterium]